MVTPVDARRWSKPENGDPVSAALKTLKTELILGGIPKISANALAVAVSNYVRAEIEAAVLKMCGAMNEEEKTIQHHVDPSKVIPPLVYQKQKSYHVLVNPEKGWKPLIAQWVDFGLTRPQWYICGESKPSTPEELFSNGWRWSRPVDM